MEIKSKNIAKMRYSLEFNPSINKYFIYSCNEAKDATGRAQTNIELACIRNKEEALKDFNDI